MGKIVLACMPVLYSAGLAAGPDPDRQVPLRTFAGEAEVMAVEVPVWVFDAEGRPRLDLPCEEFHLLEDGHGVSLTSCEAPAAKERDERYQKRESSEKPCRLIIFLDLYLATQAEVKECCRDILRRLSRVSAQREVELMAFDGTLHRYRFQAGRLDATGLRAFLRPLRAKGAVITDGEENRGVLSSEKDSVSLGARCDASRRAVEKTTRAFSTVVAAAASSCSGSEVWLYSPLLPKDTGNEVAVRPRYFGRSCSTEALAAPWRVAGQALSGVGGWLRVIDPRGVVPDPNRDQLSERLSIGEDLSRVVGGEYCRTGGCGRLHRSQAYLLTYSPEHGRDGRVHRIEVTLPQYLRLQIRWRHSYLALCQEDLEGLQAVAEALSSDDQNILGVAVRVLGEKRSGPLAVEVLVPYRGLALVPVGNELAGDLLLTVFKQSSGGERSEIVSLQGSPKILRAQENDARRRGYFAFRFKVQTGRETGTFYVVVTDRVSGSRSVVQVPFE